MNGGTEMDVRGKQSSEKRLIDYYYLAEKIECPGEPLVYWYDIEAAPTVDAVPVVRCRECKHHYWEQEPCHGKSVHYCKLPHMRGVEVFKEFFCYYGERKEGAD